MVQRWRQAWFLSRCSGSEGKTLEMTSDSRDRAFNDVKVAKHGPNNASLTRNIFWPLLCSSSGAAASRAWRSCITEQRIRQAAYARKASTEFLPYLHHSFA